MDLKSHLAKVFLIAIILLIVVGVELQKYRLQFNPHAMKVEVLPGLMKWHNIVVNVPAENGEVTSFLQNRFIVVGRLTTAAATTLVLMPCSNPQTCAELSHGTVIISESSTISQPTAYLEDKLPYSRDNTSSDAAYFLNDTSHFSMGLAGQDGQCQWLRIQGKLEPTPAGYAVHTTYSSAQSTDRDCKTPPSDLNWETTLDYSGVLVSAME